MDYLLTLAAWLQVTLLLFVICNAVLFGLCLYQRRRLQQLRGEAQALQSAVALADFQQTQLDEKIAGLQQEQRSLQSKLELKEHQYTLQNNELRGILAENQRTIGELDQKVHQASELKHAHTTLQEKYQSLLQVHAKLKEEHVSQSASLEKERQHMEDKLFLLNNAEKRLALEFENLANKIFEQKSVKFSENSEKGLNTLLNPLKTQLDEFKKQVNDHYVTEGKERASLKTEILSLKALNQKITQEAAALTSALKGDNKTQGNWGEIVLERLLEESGLRQGHEYEVQLKSSNEAGKRFYPDVVVHLPKQKDVVIDSKVSLVAYEQFVNASSDEDKSRALKAHILSVKTHIKTLSKKDYQDLTGLRTLDYVLMFMPIEAAFLNAIESEPSLVKLALDNQIMLVSPTNLLVALRTIHNIWQYEYQHENAAKIAENAKKLYDKFVGFLSDMEKVGKQIENAGSSYEQAMNKLQTGKGNIIRQLENFKSLGVNPNKSIDERYIE